MSKDKMSSEAQNGNSTKPMLQEVFLVTYGFYSDYRVCAVFTEIALAKKYIASFKGNLYEDFRIENYTLNPSKHKFGNDYKRFSLEMTKEGNCIDIYIEDSFPGVKYKDIDMAFNRHKNMIITVLAKNKTHAIKIANEKRVQLIAENIWK